jgi:Flp pilus assembly pilin Flp
MRHSISGTTRNERGATMVIVLLLLVLLAVAATAGFTRASSERRVTGDLEAQTGALMVAQSGLERYLFQTTTIPTSFPVTTSLTVNGGTAQVTLHRFKQSAGANDPTIYALTSRGTYTRARRFDARAPLAERSVSQLVRWQTASIDIDAAFTSLSGLRKNGSSGTVSGVDGCSAQPTIPGAAVPDGLHSQSGGGGSPGAYIDGNPDNAPDYLGTPGPGGTAQGEIDIDWASIVAGTMLQPDFLLVRSGSRTTGVFPTTAQYANWPVVRFNGDIGNSVNINNGQGILIVTGNADLSNVTWNGIVLVGGSGNLSGSATRVNGAIITGLNVKLGMPVPQTEVGNGNFLVRYNSCHIASALNRLGGWQRIPNAWADNWPTY